MAETKVRPSGPTIDNDDPVVHHHSKPIPRREYLRLRAAGEPLEALCGHKGRPITDPLDYPCCPMCNMLLDRPCSTEKNL